MITLLIPREVISALEMLPLTRGDIMRLVEIRDFAKEKIEDTAFWTDTKLNALANNCVRGILSYFTITRVKAEVSISTEADVMSYELPWDYIETHLLYDDTNNRMIKIEDDPELIWRGVGDRTQTGIPAIAYFWGTTSIEELRLYPVPDGVYEIDHLYWSTGANLVNDDDNPMIPREQHQHIVDYLVEKTRAEDQNSIVADRAFEAWWNGRLIDMKIANNTKTAARRNIKPGSGRQLFNSESIVMPFRLSGSTYRW